jgi:hypothetical protein
LPQSLNYEGVGELLADLSVEGRLSIEISFKGRRRRDCKSVVDLSFAFVAQEPFKSAEQLGG